MLHQRYKDFYFLLIAKATWPNYWMKKLRHAGRSRNGHRLDLHLGCGTKYLPGFVNIDANPMQKTDIWLDVRCGLPFASAFRRFHLLHAHDRTSLSGRTGQSCCASARACSRPEAE